MRSIIISILVLVCLIAFSCKKCYRCTYEYAGVIIDSGCIDESDKQSWEYTAIPMEYWDELGYDIESTCGYD